MKLEDFIKRAATAVFSEVVPGGGAILGAVNALLPSDRQLPSTATGSDVDAAIANLPAEQRALILNADIDLEKTRIVESADTTKIMLSHDAKNPQSTRPYIAKHSFHILALCAVTAVWTLCYAAVNGDHAMINALANNWALIASVIAPLVYVLKAYFGAIQTEQSQRFNAANGHPIQSGVSALIRAIKK